MATTESAEAILQRQAMEKLQGTNAVIGGKGEVIQVTPEQSQKIMGAFTLLVAELSSKKTEDLTRDEKELLAIVKQVGPKGQIDGRQACQAILVTYRKVTELEGKTTRTSQESKQLKALQEASKTLTIEVLPTEDLPWYKKYSSLYMEGHIGNRTKEHPIIAAYERRKIEIANDSVARTLNLSNEQIDDQAMAESIKLYGESEVDKLMKQVEAQKAAEMRGEQRREKHRRKDELEGELKQEKPAYDEAVDKKKGLQAEDKKLEAESRELDDQIDELDRQITALGNIDVQDVRNRLVAAQQGTRTSELAIARRKAEIEAIREQIKEAKKEKEGETVEALLTTVQNDKEEVARQKAEAKIYQANRKTLEAKRTAAAPADKPAVDAEILANEINIAQTEGRAAAAEARAKIYEERIKNAQRIGGKLTPADLTTFTDQIKDLENDNDTAEVTLIKSRQDEKTIADELNTVQKKDQALLKAKAERESKDHRRTQIVNRRTSITTELQTTGAIETTINNYQAKEREMTGVETSLQALGKAEQAAEKLAEDGKSSKIDICNALGISTAGFYDNRYIDTVNQMFGTSCTTLGSAETEMQTRRNRMNLWKLIQAAVGGARIV